jgi:hypothetical protein
MATIQHYDKFSYSWNRERSAKEQSSYVPVPVAPASTQDPSASVLTSLRHGAYSFAIGEDGVMHARVVAPPRVCYAPTITELDAPVMPSNALQRLKRELRVDSDTELARVEWPDVVRGIAALCAEDAARNEALAAARSELAARRLSVSGGGGGGEDAPAVAAVLREREAEFAAQRVTAVDRAKIELVWKRGRMLLASLPEAAADTRSGVAPAPQPPKALGQSSPRGIATSPLRVPSARASERRVPAGEDEPPLASLALHEEVASRGSSAPLPTSTAAPAPTRTSIFNEKLRWSAHPKVDSNNRVR